MTDWDERFAAGDYPREPEPSPVLRSYEPSIPDGRALDVAAGTGRNAVFLAEAGYAVDALDASREGLRIIGERAAEEGIGDRIEPIRGDVATYGFPSEAYELITMSFFHTLDRFADLAEALVPGGYLFVEGHLRSASPTPSGPSDDRYRFAANELLQAIDLFGRTRDPTDDDERYLLTLLRGADDGERPPPEVVSDGWATARGLGYANAIDDYRRDVSEWLDDHPDPEARKTLGTIHERIKRVQALQGDVSPTEAESLVRATCEVGAYLMAGEESSLASARERLR